MNIGSLYTVKMCFWLLFPTKETADTARTDECLYHTAVHAYTAYWSIQLNCAVSYFPPDSIVVFLEEDGELKKVLTSDGRIGWIWWFGESCKDSFEEVKAKS